MVVSVTECWVNHTFSETCCEGWILEANRTDRIIMSIAVKKGKCDWRGKYSVEVFRIQDLQWCNYLFTSSYQAWFISYRILAFRHWTWIRQHVLSCVRVPTSVPTILLQKVFLELGNGNMSSEMDMKETVNGLGGGGIGREYFIISLPLFNTLTAWTICFCESRWLRDAYKWIKWNRTNQMLGCCSRAAKAKLY